MMMHVFWMHTCIEEYKRGKNRSTNTLVLRWKWCGRRRSCASTMLWLQKHVLLCGHFYDLVNLPLLYFSEFGKSRTKLKFSKKIAIFSPKKPSWNKLFWSISQFPFFRYFYLFFPEVNKLLDLFLRKYKNPFQKRYNWKINLFIKFLFFNLFMTLILLLSVIIS